MPGSAPSQRRVAGRVACETAVPATPRTGRRCRPGSVALEIEVAVGLQERALVVLLAGALLELVGATHVAVVDGEPAGRQCGRSRSGPVLDEEVLVVRAVR